MLRILDLLFNLLPLRALFSGHAGRPIHFSSRSRRRMNRARFVTHLE